MSEFSNRRQALEDKIDRQIILTSHNANLVVLSDADHIVTFEGKGDQGIVLERGFLAGEESRITSHVVDILDGGERALSGVLCSGRR